MCELPFGNPMFSLWPAFGTASLTCLTLGQVIVIIRRTDFLISDGGIAGLVGV